MNPLETNSPFPDDEAAPIEIPITGELDLHTFRPKDIKELVPDYIGACLERERYRLRIIHGKGTGALREWVHKILRDDPRVASFRLGDETTGGWGATIVILRR